MRAYPHKDGSLYWIYGLFILILVFNIGFWLYSKKFLPQWNNIPPVPSKTAMVSTGLGDNQISYRLTGYFLQNTGNVGGLYESLKKYDYQELEKWFYLSEELDPRANYVPFLAAYYFGALEDPSEKLTPVIDYLAHHGTLDYPQKWRWLAHAVYLSRYKQSDMEKALGFANTLAGLKTDVAPWARQMSAFVHIGMGNNEAAYEMMVRMLATEKDNLHPNEVNEMLRFICTRALNSVQAAQNPLCQKTP